MATGQPSNALGGGKPQAALAVTLRHVASKRLVCVATTHLLAPRSSDAHGTFFRQLYQVQTKEMGTGQLGDPGVVVARTGVYVIVCVCERERAYVYSMIPSTASLLCWLYCFL